MDEGPGQLEHERAVAHRVVEQGVFQAREAALQRKIERAGLDRDAHLVRRAAATDDRHSDLGVHVELAEKAVEDLQIQRDAGVGIGALGLVRETWDPGPSIESKPPISSIILRRTAMPAPRACICRASCIEVNILSPVRT